jgi:hypothetical protein
MGPAVIAAWRQGPVHAVALVGAFYGVMVTGLMAFIMLASAAHRLPPRAHHALVAASAVILAALGLSQLLAAVP